MTSKSKIFFILLFLVLLVGCIRVVEYDESSGSSQEKKSVQSYPTASQEQKISTSEKEKNTHCGDYECQPTESCSSCASDCGSCKKKDGESCSNKEDCLNGYCVHNVCRSSPIYCGDTHCDAGEDHLTCLNDCKKPDGVSCVQRFECLGGFCVHGICRSEKEYCGDTYCDTDENNICKKDCVWCGDGDCNQDEACNTCSVDCGECAPVCGDAKCNGAENMSSCPGDCWFPWNYPNTYKKVEVINNTVTYEYLCANDFCVNRDESVCGNSNCEYYEDSSCIDCSCKNKFGVLDRNLAYSGFYNQCFNANDDLLEDIQGDLNNIQNFIEQQIGISTKPTNDDTEIWKRTMKIWDWASENWVLPTKEVDGIECWKYRFGREWGEKGEYDFDLPIDKFPELYNKYDGFCYGSCIDTATIFTKLLVVSGIPKNRIAIFGLNAKDFENNHQYNGLLVNNKWYYLDFTCYFYKLEYREPSSFGCFKTDEVYRHPYEGFSPAFIMPGVPILESEREVTLKETLLGLYDNLIQEFIQPKKQVNIFKNT